MAIEILSNIFTFMPMSSLLEFASSCKDHRTWVLQYINRRTDTALAKFVTSPLALLDTMRITSSVISGSLPLDLFLPEAAVTWETADMDIYTREIQHLHIILFLIHDGYTITPPSHHTPDSDDSNPAIKDIMTMKKSNHTIDVVISKTSSSIRPIFYFHSTVIMNISCDTFYVSYPQLTSQYRGLTNPLSQLTADDTKTAVKKYKCRGFAIVDHATIWDTGADECHNCDLNIWCPGHQRSNRDGNCMRLRLDRPDNILPLTEHTEEEVVVWNFGGKKSRAGCYRSQPYIYFC
ncbi:hypothetical protein BJ138DRAFT_1106033 [Hygrophoropsis aurantiaca]|uniref:Uncharacterized protein n=1 Tax=Hygrophoropsis aurantiaca TaxID=72124 RepID=A0ACB7ZXI2_9AGAM|nr:hypothetical protein BJ138DRAFT_1106033 [Hygrophoropsis aurantiaca]